MIHLPKHPVFTQCQAHFRQCRMSFYSTCLVYMHSTVQAGDTFQTLPSSLRDTLQLLDDSILQIKTENFGVSNP